METDYLSLPTLLNRRQITLDDVYDRQCNKEILATTALYGPWKPDHSFDWGSYERLVKETVQTASVPATNVDTTWAIYNDWSLTKELIWKTAEWSEEYQNGLAADRPLVVAGLNTNPFDISISEIASALYDQIKEIDAGLRQRGLTNRIRYMPVPDHRLYEADTETKIKTYREMGRVIGQFTDFGLVFFELDIGIKGFGSNFTTQEIAAILSETVEIQEYKSALITQKPYYQCQYDYCDDMVRIRIVETVAPDRIQFSTGNDWFISLARYGKYIDKFGYLLGASQSSPRLYKLWREFVQAAKPCALALEQDLQALAKDFWTPNNVGVYRHYLGVFLAMTGLIDYALPHPDCESRYRVKPEDYFLPLKHAIRLSLVDPKEAPGLVKRFVPGADGMSDHEIQKRLEYLN
jgi:hypothetical protein